MRSGVLHHAELLFHVRGLVDSGDGRARKAVEQALSGVALRDPADDQIDSEQHPVNLREVSDERVEDVEIAIDRDDAELEELFPDRGAEECLEEHRVPEPDEAVQEPGHVPSQTQECDREHEEQVDGRDDEAIDQGREEPVDPMLQQGRVVADQVKGRRHGSPIRRRRYRTRLHKCIGRE